MVIIRFVRVGRSRQAYFHLVAAEKSKAVQKKYIEKLGSYDPHANKGEGNLVFNQERVLHFLKNGAQISQSVARLLVKQGVKEAGKFVEERPTKPQRTTPPTTEAPKEETPEATEEKSVEETSVQEVESETETSPTDPEPVEEKEEDSAEEKPEESPVLKKENPTEEAEENENKEKSEDKKDEA